MTYPGNDSLSPDIRQRILETFKQTLELSAQGSRQEALLGCDFILRLDSLFEPARLLQKRLKSDEAEIRLDDLQAAFAAAVESQVGEGEEAPRADTAEIPLEEQETLELRQEDLDELAAGLDELEISEGAEAEAPAEPVAPETAAETVEEPAPPEAAAEAPAEPEEPAPEEAAEEPAAAVPPSLGEPAAALDAESEQRIQDLLAEGQEAFERAEYQSAIDAWSRIFLIDIEHPEANRRIELARKLKAEVERSVEEAFHEGIRQLEGGDVDAAQAAFEKVLEIQPDHLTAREYLEKLEGEGPPPTVPAAPEPAEIEAPEEQPEESLSVPEEAVAPAEAPAEEPAPPPRRRPAPAALPGRAAAKGRPRAFLYLAAAVLAVVALGGWFLYSNWSRFFPNAAETPATPAPARPDPIQRAKDLHSRGMTSIAVAQLRRLPPSHPLYTEAQALIAQLESASQPDQPEAGEEPSEAALARRSELIDAARAAYRGRSYLRAEELLQEAAAIAPLDESLTQLGADASERLEPLRQQIEIFHQGEWEYALRDLWRMREADPKNLDITRLMVDSYYNLGVRDLQRGSAASAAEQFKEALSLTDGDPELERLAAFARTYQERQQDLLYRIFVKYLPFR